MKTAPRFKDLPKKYRDLTGLLPPRPIRSESEYEDVQEMIDALAGHRLNRDQADYLDALATFLAAYEQEHHAIDTSDLSGIEVLKHLLDESRMNASDLARLLDMHPTMGSKILRGERSLTVDHLRKLSAHFCVSPELFM